MCKITDISITDMLAKKITNFDIIPTATYLRPSCFNDTLILAIFVSMDLAHINFSDFTKNYSLFKQ